MVDNFSITISLYNGDVMFIKELHSSCVSKPADKIDHCLAKSEAFCDL